MKSEDNWKHQSLETLEKSVWPPLQAGKGSYLIITCHALRKKSLLDFTVEDLRIMIGQDIGLKFLLPLAVDVLSEDILAEGDFYPGDLLKSVLGSDAAYWKIDRAGWKTVCDLFEKHADTLRSCETNWEIRKGWFDTFDAFRKLH